MQSTKEKSGMTLRQLAGQQQQGMSDGAGAKHAGPSPEQQEEGDVARMYEHENKATEELERQERDLSGH
jgi:hypothetical protein